MNNFGRFSPAPKIEFIIKVTKSERSIVDSCKVSSPLSSSNGGAAVVKDLSGSTNSQNMSVAVAFPGGGRYLRSRGMRSLRNETALTPIEAVRSKYERSVGSPV